MPAIGGELAGITRYGGMQGIETCGITGGGRGMSTATCEICGVTFPRNSSTDKYCPACRQQAYRDNTRRWDDAHYDAIMRSKANYRKRKREERQNMPPLYIRKCRVCGCVFETNNARKESCSESCALRARSLQGRNINAEVEHVMSLPYDQRWQYTKDWTEEHCRLARKIEMRRIRDDAEIDSMSETCMVETSDSIDTSCEPTECPSVFFGDDGE